MYKGGLIGAGAWFASIKEHYGQGSCQLLAVELIQILFHHKGIDKLAALRGEGQLVDALELLNDEAEHHLLTVGGIGEELSIGGDAGIGLLLEGG